MKIAIVQYRPVMGDIPQNIKQHIRLIDLAVEHKASVVIFPELSITGYEPEIASQLATTQNDPRFNIFQKISNSKRITIGIGAPTTAPDGIAISMILFQPRIERQTFSKRFLHHSETPFFVAGEGYNGFKAGTFNIGIAICYELLVPEHQEIAFENGAEVYIASVVESVNGVDKAIAKLSETAGKYGMTTFMANCIGQTGAYNCPGKSSVWNNTGQLIGQLANTQEGVLTLDIISGAITEVYADTEVA